MAFQRTIGRAVGISGVGVHSGKAVRLSLAPSESGRILFRRVDLSGLEAPLTADNVDSINSTSLDFGAFYVRTVEHLLASLSAFGVRSVVVELDSDEIPILDGSARPFAEMLASSGTRDIGPGLEPLKILTPFRVEEAGSWVAFEPPAPEDPALDLSYTIAYEHPAIGVQSRSVRLTAETFSREVAPARTFGFLRDVERLRRQGLALGASKENTIVLDADGVINGPLRFEDEFVRHKLLDLAGDLALLGRPILGRISAFRAGHRLHVKAVRRLLDHPGLRAGS
jgi:UDP-3-O-[3-hydroxymyristoyl] N-acetylglucosamine deacetylase